jgi:hypothetical protein
MKLRNIIFGLSLLLFSENLFGQTNQEQRLIIPGLDPASQSNVVITVCDFYGGQPCPLEYTNMLSNTNLFTPKEQKLIEGIFVKYKNVTTNSGPLDTVLIGLYKTNFIIKAMDRTAGVENWIARYQYTNSEAYEEITIGKSLSARFRTKSNDGYNMYFNRTGSGTMLGFTEIKQDLINGVLAEFEDAHPQGVDWNFRRADFSNSRLFEYRQYTNGMVFGKYLMWNLRNGNLSIEAEFKEPYDWKKNYRPFFPR